MDFGESNWKGFQKKLKIKEILPRKRFLILLKLPVNIVIVVTMSFKYLEEVGFALLRMVFFVWIWFLSLRFPNCFKTQNV